MHRYQLRLHPHRAGSTFRYLYRYKYVSRPTAAGWVDLSSIVLAEFAFDCADAMYRVPPPPAETMTKGGHFRHPGRRWQLCVAGYFADRGVGDMPGAPRYTYIIATPEAVAGCPATDDSCGVDNENWTCGVRRLRRQVDSMCVCSDGGAVWRALLGALGGAR